MIDNSFYKENWITNNNYNIINCNHNTDKLVYKLIKGLDFGIEIFITYEK